MNDTALPSETFNGYIEANSTWSVRYLDPSSFECILSIQAGTGVEALKKAESAITHLIEAKCIPIRKTNPNGSKQGKGNNSGPTILAKPNGKNPVCPLHQVEMTKWAKNGKTWYSHRWEDGWCNGKKQ